MSKEQPTQLYVCAPKTPDKTILLREGQEFDPGQIEALVRWYQYRGDLPDLFERIDLAKSSTGCRRFPSNITVRVGRTELGQFGTVFIGDDVKATLMKPGQYYLVTQERTDHNIEISGIIINSTNDAMLRMIRQR